MGASDAHPEEHGIVAVDEAISACAAGPDATHAAQERAADGATTQTSIELPASAPPKPSPLDAAKNATASVGDCSIGDAAGLEEDADDEAAALSAKLLGGMALAEDGQTDEIRKGDLVLKDDSGEHWVTNGRSEGPVKCPD